MTIPAVMTYIMLNPSTASAKRDDPTIRRCIGFARDLGYGGLYVVNLYAKRATDPRDLAVWDDPVGPENDHWIRWAYDRAEQTVLAWGNSVTKISNHEARIKEVLALIDYPFASYPLCFGRTRRGQPRHPLMLRADAAAHLEDY